MPAERVPVIYAGVDVERFHPELGASSLRHEIGIAAEAKVVAMVARFQRVKGHHIFQALAERVLEEQPDTHFIVAGDDVFGVGTDQRYRDDILARARQSAVLRERLHYVGFRHDVEAVYAAADVFVCPSEFESYGVANLEAMACGLPVISTDRGGPKETIVDGETGYLVESGDVATFAAKVLGLLDDPALRDRIGEAGRRRVETCFSTAAASTAHTRIYEDLLRLS